VITLRPKHREARRLLALAHATLGDVGEAVKIFEEWLDEEPSDPIARHMLAACTGRDVPPRASNGFVERTFDGFFRQLRIEARGLVVPRPGLVAAMIEDSGLERSKRFDVLDAGCGTGLCGLWLAPYARRLTGVDLSSGMLARAKEKQVYDALTQAELTEYLSHNREPSISSCRRTRSCTSETSTAWWPLPQPRSGRTAFSCSRSSMRPARPMPATVWNCTAATVMAAPTWNGCSLAAGSKRNRPRRLADGGREGSSGAGGSGYSEFPPEPGCE
jgi:hypothetical protein